jgi:hypothetical protein
LKFNLTVSLHLKWINKHTCIDDLQ